MQGARDAILAGNYTEYCDTVRAAWAEGDS